MELTGENRLIVQKGLECITLGEQIGVKALIEVAGLDEKRLDSTSLAFGIAPRINAAGRLGQADLGDGTTVVRSFSQAFELATELNSLNEHRKQLVDAIYSEIDRKIAQHPEILRERLIILYGKGWHHGVIGLQQQDWVEEYSKASVFCFP